MVNHPIEEFLRWFDEARAAGEDEPEKMALATAGLDGHPSVRYVLFRGLTPDGEGLRFFTDYESRKSSQLTANPFAAMAFYWPKCGRQVRLEGAVTRLGAAESDAYFASRPRGHQLAASVSPQSRPIAYEELLTRYAAAEAVHAGGRPVPRPERWGGWRLDPRRVELWQRRENRLHERIEWTRGKDGWQSTAIAP